jgi:hypothetical protein
MARLERISPLHAIDEQSHGLVDHVDDRMLGAREIRPQAPDSRNIVCREDKDALVKIPVKSAAMQGLIRLSRDGARH